MYNENSRGLRTDPCGTPYFTVDNLKTFSLFGLLYTLRITCCTGDMFG